MEREPTMSLVSKKYQLYQHIPSLRRGRGHNPSSQGPLPHAGTNAAGILLQKTGLAPWPAGSCYTAAHSDMYRAAAAAAHPTADLVAAAAAHAVLATDIGADNQGDYCGGRLLG